MTSTRSMAGKGLHFPASLETDAAGVIVPAPVETLPTIAAQVDPDDLIYFAHRLINGVRRRRRQIRWSAINEQRIELARLCLDRATREAIVNLPMLA